MVHFLKNKMLLLTRRKVDTFILNLISFSVIILFSFQNTFASKIIQSGFIENKGQIVDQNFLPNNNVLFLFAGKGTNIQLRKTGYSFEVFNIENSPQIITGKIPDIDQLKKLTDTKIQLHRVDIEFNGMNPNTKIITEQGSTYCFNYFTNGRDISNVHYFTKVIYKELYPQIDMEFITDGDTSVKYNIILHAGADINKIKLLVCGTEKTELQNGCIVYSTSLGPIREFIPSSFYSDSPSLKVKIDFLVNGNCISFSGKYNKTKELTIDPSSNRIWGTYYGDVGSEYCNSVGIDSLNNSYITGYTLSTNNIATSGVYQSTLTGSYDIFLVKFDASGTRLWGTYFGGSSVDAAYKLFVEKNGNVYVCGDTFSTSNIATTSAHQTSYGGGIDDAILVKFNTNGQRIWSTYYGGTLHDIASGITTDKYSNVIICGHTESLNAIATTGSYNENQSGSFDVFIAKFDSSGNRLWGTYYGDVNTEEGWAIDADKYDNIYITGFTMSSNNIATTGTYQTVFAGNSDAYIAKFNSAGSNLLWATYYGGPGTDQGSCIKIGNENTIIIAGNTNSTTNISFNNAYQQNIGSAEDVFVARFDSNGVRQWATYLGGNGTDYLNDMVLDSNMNILVCGSTLSSNVMSTSSSWQNAIGSTNSYDSYIAKYNSSGIKKLGTYYGGAGNDEARGIDIDGNGKIYITGNTSSNSNIASSGAYMTTIGGGADAFLAKFCLAPEPVITHAGTDTLCKGSSLVLNSQNNFSSYLWTDNTTTSTTLIPDTLSAGTYFYNVAVTDGFGCDGISDSTKIVVDICTSVNEKMNREMISLYPVPSNDIVTVSINKFSDEKTEIEIYSSEGKLVEQLSSNEKKISIDLKKLSAGILFLSIKMDGKMISRKFIHH